jgi:hypothetical protein
VFIINSVDVNDINITLKLNVMHIATADPRTEIKRKRYIMNNYNPYKTYYKNNNRRIIFTF